MTTKTAGCHKNGRSMFAYLDYAGFLPFQHITFHPSSAVLHYGHAVFEGLSLIKDGNRLNLFHPWLNLERMRYGAEEVGLGMSSLADEAIIGNIFALAAVNGFHRRDCPLPFIQRGGKKVNRLYIRPLLFAESESIGLGAKMRSRLLITITPMTDYIRHGEAGISAMLFPFARNVPFPTVKAAANYQLSIFSRRKMESFNKDNGESCVETLFTNPKGFITEGSGENVVLLRDGMLISPPPSEGALPGITLRMIATAGKKHGIGFKFGTFRLSDIQESDCLFLTGNAAGIVPVSRIAEVGPDYFRKRWHDLDSAQNPAFRKLKQEYELMETAQAGFSHLHARMDDWLSFSEAQRLFSLSGDRIDDVQDSMGIAGKSVAGKIRPRFRRSCLHGTRHNTLVEEYGISKWGIEWSKKLR